jgi:hypothetical protein
VFYDIFEDDPPPTSTTARAAQLPVLATAP